MTKTLGWNPESRQRPRQNRRGEGGNMDEESLLSNRSGGIMEDESLRRNHGGGKLKEESWEASGMHRGSIWDASGKHLGGILGASWKHLGSIHLRFPPPARDMNKKRYEGQGLLK